jgi:hypothetical protein
MTERDPVCDACGGGQFGSCPFCWIQPPEAVMTPKEQEAWIARERANAAARARTQLTNRSRTK